MTIMMEAVTWPDDEGHAVVSAEPALPETGWIESWLSAAHQLSPSRRMTTRARDVWAAMMLVNRASQPDDTPEAPRASLWPRGDDLAPLRTNPSWRRLEAGTLLTSRICRARGNGLTPVQALELGRDADAFLRDPGWMGQRLEQRDGTDRKYGTYWQQLHRAALLLLAFNRLAKLHLSDREWTGTTIFAEIGKHYPQIVAPARIPEGLRKCTAKASTRVVAVSRPRTGGDVKNKLFTGLTSITDKPDCVLASILLHPDAELAERYHIPV
jgi:hypothetical protein